MIGADVELGGLLLEWIGRWLVHVPAFENVRLNVARLPTALQSNEPSAAGPVCAAESSFV